MPRLGGRRRPIRPHYGGAPLRVLNNYVLTAGSGTYSITGATAGLAPARKITASSGSYSVSGASVGLLSTRRLSVASGSYSITGSSATFRSARRITATGGVYAITGSDANLVHPTNAYHNVIWIRADF